MAGSVMEPTAAVLDLMLLRDAERVRERHCTADAEGRCAWCRGHWPCAARQLAERAEQVATGAVSPTTPLLPPVSPVGGADTVAGTSGPSVPDDVVAPAPAMGAGRVVDGACVATARTGTVAVPSGLAAVPTVRIPAVLSGPRRMVTRRAVRARRDAALITAAQSTTGTGTALAVRTAVPATAVPARTGRSGWRWGFMGRRSA